MKQYIGIVFLSVTFSCFPAAQEALTGSSLKSAYKQCKEAVGDSTRLIWQGHSEKAILKELKDLLKYIDKKKASVDDIKAYLNDTIEEHRAENKKLDEREDKEHKSFREVIEHADKLVEMAAHKIGG